MMTFAKGSKEALLKDLSANKIPYRLKTWTNYMETIGKRSAVIVQVDEEIQVQKLMLAIKKQNEQHSHHKITARATAGWQDEESSWCCFPWAKAQEHRYNESFSFSDGVPADIIIRFSKKYQKVKTMGKLKEETLSNSNNPINTLQSYQIQVSAGVQIATLAEQLRKLGLSLRTASMLAWASAVGLAGTGGHGTGRDEPAFSGQIMSLKVCDVDGNIREITREHKDFAALCGAHSGMLGVVLSMNLKVVEAFNLKETISNFPDVKTMGPQLSKLLTENQYFSLIGVPTYGCPETGKLIDKWHIRLWNHTNESPTKIQKAPYTADARSFAQELSVRSGDSIQEFLLDSKLQQLFPFYMLLSAGIITNTRGTAPIVDFENHITHYQVAFPKAMRDVSYFVSVKDAEAGDLLAKILQKIDELLEAAAKRGEYPITYAIYTRYIKGTNGGISTSATSSDDERVLAIDMVTNPNAPGIARFERAFLESLAEIGVKPRFHLGKNFPADINSYADFLSTEAIAEFKDALVRWYGSEEQLTASPFMTPYLEQMLQTKPTMSHTLIEKIQTEQPRNEHSTGECVSFLQHLIGVIETLPSEVDETNHLKKAFLSQCNETLASLKSELKTNLVEL